MRLKELHFYMDGTTPSVKVTHDLEPNGATETVNVSIYKSGIDTDIVMALAKSIVRKVKSDARKMDS